MKVLIIIPAYNEAKKIFNVIRGVLDSGYEVLVVDDGSSDATTKESRRAGVIILRHFVNRGYGAALTTGNVYALKNNYDIAVHFDADGQHEVGDIKKLIEPIMSGQVDVTLGSRFLDNSANVPLVRKSLLKAAVIFTRVFSGIKLTDAHNGLRAFSNSALSKIDCRQDGMTYASEIIDQIAEQRLRWREIPVTIKYTDYSKAKGESNIKKVLLGARFIWGKIIR